MGLCESMSDSRESGSFASRCESRVTITVRRLAPYEHSLAIRFLTRASHRHRMVWPSDLIIECMSDDGEEQKLLGEPEPKAPPVEAERTVNVLM